jgi:hypothetical protein
MSKKSQIIFFIDLPANYAALRTHPSNFVDSKRRGSKDPTVVYSGLQMSTVLVYEA